MSARVPDLGVPTRLARTTSADGTSIAYYVIGTGPKVWLMPPAMGAPLVCMKHVLRRFASEYTIVTWDQRGFYASGVPARPDAQSVEDHLLDMEAVVAATGIDRFVLGGWSMGVQLALEYHHRRPHHVRALVLLNGAAERVLSGVAPSAGLERLAIAALRGAVRANLLLRPLSRAILGAPGMAQLLHRVGFLADNPAFFSEILAEFSQVDWGRYFTMTELLHRHSAAPYLPEIAVPTLITAGTKDFLTPVRAAERMHHAIRGSELFVIEGATHYVVAEYPDRLADRIARFLERVDAASFSPE